MNLEIKVEENNVVVKNDTRSISVSKNKRGNNVIHIKGLTSLVGKEKGTKHFLSEDELIKNTIIGLSDEGIIALTQALILHSEKVLGAIIE